MGWYPGKWLEGWLKKVRPQVSPEKISKPEEVARIIEVIADTLEKMSYDALSLTYALPERLAKSLEHHVYVEAKAEYEAMRKLARRMKEMPEHFKEPIELKTLYNATIDRLSWWIGTLKSMIEDAKIRLY